MREEKIYTISPIISRAGIWLDCGEGWDPLIMELCRDLENILYEDLEDDEYHEEDLPVILQIKESGGGLRFYLSQGTEKMYHRIALSEAFSFHICEICGVDYFFERCPRCSRK